MSKDNNMFALGLFVGVFLGAILMPSVFSPSVTNMEFFDGGDIKVIRLEKIGGTDRIYVLPDEPNQTRCLTLRGTLDKKFGEGGSAERMAYEGRVKELVGWWEKKK